MSCVLLDPQIPEQLALAVELLRRDQPVALPTETVYGLGGRLGSEEALARVFALKARPHFDPLIVHVLGSDDVARLTLELAPLHERLIKAFWPGPLTLLAPKNPKRVPDLCTSGSPFVALRSPEHPIFRQVLEALGEPIAAPSANRFGRISPTRALDVVRELGPHGLEAVVEGGPARFGVESTIVRVVSEREIEVLRPGAIALEALREAAGSDVRIQVRATANATENPDAPGMLASHYAPRAPLIFVEDPAAAAVPVENPGAWSLLIGCAPERLPPEWREKWMRPKWARVSCLSAGDSDSEAAANLFRTLRHLDEVAPPEGGIVALRLPDRGLGLAVNDRLRRAGAKR